MAFVPRVAAHFYDNADRLFTDPYIFSSNQFTPAAGELLILDVFNAVTSGTPGTPVPTDTGLHIWTQQSTLASGVRRRTRFSAPDNGSTAASTLTVTFTDTELGCVFEIAAVTGVDTAQGTSGFIQNITGSGTAVTATVTLAAFGSSNNACFFGATGLQNISPTGNNLTNATGFPVEDKGATPSQSSNIGWQSSSNTAPSFTWAASAAYVAIGSEIALSGAGPTLRLRSLTGMGL